MPKNDIQSLVFSFMDLVGIDRTVEWEGVWRAQIPEKERPFFNGYEVLRFTFERAQAEKHRELELISEGAYLLRKIIERLAGIPKVSRLYGVGTPQLPPIEPGRVPELRVLTPGKAHYRQQVMFNFKVAFRCDQHREGLYSALADPAKHEIYLTQGLGEIDLTQYQETPTPGLPVDESGEDVLRLYLQACRKLEEEVLPEIQSLQDVAGRQYKVEYDKVCKFLEEQKQELRKKKDNVCFHLYFFQKEEEIDKMIADLESERLRKLEELQEKFNLKVEISLINAVVLCIPTLGVPASQVRKKKRDLGLPPRMGEAMKSIGLSPAV